MNTQNSFYCTHCHKYGLACNCALRAEEWQETLSYWENKLADDEAKEGNSKHVWNLRKLLEMAKKND